MKIQEMHIQNWQYNLPRAGAEEKNENILGGVFRPFLTSMIGDVYTKSWSGADEAMQLSGT